MEIEKEKEGPEPDPLGLAFEWGPQGKEPFPKARIDAMFQRFDELQIPPSLYNSKRDYREDRFTLLIHEAQSTQPCLTVAPVGDCHQDDCLRILHTLNIGGQNNHWFFWVQCVKTGPEQEAS